MEKKSGVTTLMKLPEEVKQLVNTGIYALYSIEPVRNAQFALAVKRDAVILLSEEGEIVSEEQSLDRFQLLKSIRFPDLKSAEGLKANSL